MADRKYSDDIVLSSLADGDLINVLDISDPSDGAGGTSKQISTSDLVSEILSRIAEATPYAEYAVSTSQNLGGANGTIAYIDWDGTPVATNSAFAHSISTNPSRITCNFTGRVEVVFTANYTNTSAARATLRGLYRVNGGSPIYRGSLWSYSRSSFYGEGTPSVITEIDVANGDYLEFGTLLNVSDLGQGLDTIPAECQIIIRRVDGLLRAV